MIQGILIAAAVIVVVAIVIAFALYRFYSWLIGNID